MTLEERVFKIEQILGLRTSLITPPASTLDDALTSFLAGNSKPLNQLIDSGYFKLNNAENKSQVKSINKQKKVRRTTKKED